jgi:N6-adenosine-specific RNA methylase IME4
MWPFGSLKTLAYDLIIADPPWDFVNYSAAGTKKGADPHYDVMDLSAIKSLPVSHLARGDCLLLLWATGCMLPQALETMKAWNFTFKSEIIWHKTTINGKTRMGTGYRVRTMHEPILVGTIGNPRHRPFPSYFQGLAREHSRKPDAFYDIVETCAPKLTRAELFARQERPGFDAWGNEVSKFAAE